MFGAAKPATGGGMFGGAAKPASGGGMFGAAKPATGGGMFGGAAKPSAGGGMFGAAKPANGGGMVGGAAKPASGGGMFGGAAKPASGGGMFGGAAKPAAGGGMFGAAKPATGGGMFGGAAGGAATGGGMFGGAAGGLGSGNKPGFGATPATGGFGGGAGTMGTLSAGLNANSKISPEHLVEDNTALTNKTVQEVVEYWENRVRDHEQHFANAVKVMKIYDEKLFNVHTRVTKCTNELITLENNFVDLGNHIDSMESVQDQVEKNLDELERDVQQKISDVDKTREWTTADVQREKNYQLAEEVDREVVNMMKEIQSITQQLDIMEDSTEVQGDDFTKIVRVVDYQLRAMNDLKAQVESLQVMRRQASELLDLQHQQLAEQTVQRHQRAGNFSNGGFNVM